MVWAGVGVGAMYSKWCEAKIHEIDGVLRLPWMRGKGWGLWVVGKKEKGRMKKKKRKQKKDEETFFGFHHRSCLGYSYSAAVPKRRFLMDGDIGCTRRSSWR